MRRRFSLLMVLMLVFSVLVTPGLTSAREIGADSQPETSVRYSHRLIVELQSPSLSEAWASGAIPSASSADGKLDATAATAQQYVQQLQSEQQSFVAAMQAAVPNAQVSSFINESGQTRPETVQIVLNAVVVDAGQSADVNALERHLSRLPGVKRVSRDRAIEPDMYASLPLINAAAAWNNSAIGGKGNAGAGIKFASVDGGAHHAAPMFDGTGYTYPPGYPKGDPKNNNGKIIVSRAYFRPWDPPAPGDENTWPGAHGTPHGTHTSSTAAGNEVVASYRGVTETISGVAPRAFIQSYRVFYASINGLGSFFEAEGLAALEDVVKDDADVLNNSWGNGPIPVNSTYDPIEHALVNTWKAGVFVSMSAGNAGPGIGTGDHPADEYINVAASTTAGTFASGRFNVTAPAPVPENLVGLSFSAAAFGASLPLGTVIGPYDYLPAAVVDAANANGCAAFPEGAFAGKAAVIIRGACEFGLKALNAQNAGATFVLVYNSASGGDGLINMGPGAVGSQVTIGAIFIGNTNGTNVVNWYTTNGSGAFAIDTTAYQAGNTPDRIINFSSRGPSVNLTLKPDIAAPGVNILAQGYGDSPGEAGALEFGQASGTSMASPHVAGSAVLLRQIHPSWGNAWIKSALMSTSKYLDMYNFDETPAQPLDMGAGRLDLTSAADPGVILTPPSLSFGKVISGTTGTLNVQVTSVANASETYTLSTVYTGNGFDQLAPVAGMTVTPASLTLAPGETKTVTVMWDTAQSMGYGDNQGYVVLDGSTHDAHLPAWMRVGYETPGVDVLVIDNDGSSVDVGPDYTGFYTTTLEALGRSYEVWDADLLSGEANAIPDATVLARYPNIIYETGDNYQATALTQSDLDRLNEYFNGGGRLIALGQDLSSVTGGAVTDPNAYTQFYNRLLGATWLQDSVNDENVYTDTAQLITGAPGQPFSNMSFDISARGDGAGNQGFVDEITRGFVQDAEYLAHTSFPILKYSVGGNYVQDGFVAVSNRDQPTLERPGITMIGRSLYFSFGLEGVNSDTGFNTRKDLLGAALDWVNDSASVAIDAQVNGLNAVSIFTATVTSTLGGDGTSYRWDFGDGSVYTDAHSSQFGGHTYTKAGTYTVRVEATNELGTRVLGETQITIEPAAAVTVTLPLVADTWVNGGDQSTNFNAFAALIGRTTGLDNVLLAFDRSLLPTGAEIVSAELDVNVTGQSGQFGKTLVASNVNAFNPATVTFATAPLIYNPGAALPVPNAGGPVAFDVASQVAAWDAVAAQAADSMGNLAISSAGPGGRVILDSLESYQGHPATLTVTYRPQ